MLDGKEGGTWFRGMCLNLPPKNTQLTYLHIYRSTPTWWKRTAFLFMNFSCGTREDGASAESRVGLRYHGGLVVEEKHLGQRTNESASKQTNIQTNSSCYHHQA